MRAPPARFDPDPTRSRAEMEALQRELVEEAVFADDLPVVPAEVGDAGEGAPVVAGVDQAFRTDRDPEQAVSAIVLWRGGEVLERAHAVVDCEFPYVPGLLAFREAGSILAAFDALERDPDLALFDGSGRIHFRQAGLATHVGTALDLPSVGVAKSLLCGTPREPVDALPQGARVPIEVREGDDVDAPVGTVIGYAYQSRQFPDSKRINPLYVSPGHRVSAETAVDLVERCAGDYKLPEPTRLADSYADEVKSEL
ncbi:endonuclease V [Haloglomus litoreum]|uniref:endonuclease V n=1 Tax=Haloglomus litoreum TaxID=3034026 RepID=UPI0023E8F910|nr:endonuclease V [Haloglomus sp. DT116]